MGAGRAHRERERERGREREIEKGGDAYLSSKHLLMQSVGSKSQGVSGLDVVYISHGPINECGESLGRL